MKTFNTTGACVPEKNYMVDLSSRLDQIKAMVDAGAYFTINRARQYGKTTTLTALIHLLRDHYDVLSLDFQGISTSGFASEQAFIKSFIRLIRREKLVGFSIPVGIEEMLDKVVAEVGDLDDLFEVLSKWCAERRIVLIIDEVDSATNFQVFMDFLAHLRDGYLRRETKGAAAFHSVILAGVTDVKNLKRKLRPEEAHKFNSPWNIAADFNVDMSFSASDISGMLSAYEADHHTGMDVDEVAQTIHDYTSGYPFLVSRICQLLDADAVLPWNADGISEIVRRILMEKNTLFDSLMGKVQDNDKLRAILWKILFAGETVSYNPDETSISDAEMYGLVYNNHGTVKVSNRIFETRIYNFFLSQKELDSPTYNAGAGEKKAFIINGRLDMDSVLEHYTIVYNDIYRNETEEISEAQGRLRFLLFIRPIINGTGNYYIETQTLDGRRMDLVIDYMGERFVIELKIWRGNAYNERGEDQLIGYLKDFHLSKGYMLSYNFNKNKQIGMRRIMIDGRELVEAVV